MRSGAWTLTPVGVVGQVWGLRGVFLQDTEAQAAPECLDENVVQSDFVSTEEAPIS